MRTKTASLNRTLIVATSLTSRAAPKNSLPRICRGMEKRKGRWPLAPASLYTLKPRISMDRPAWTKWVPAGVPSMATSTYTILFVPFATRSV